MSVQIISSLHDNERYMVGAEESVEEFRERDLLTQKDFAAAEEAHELWFDGAKREHGISISDHSIIADARKHLDAARNLQSPVKNGTSTLDSRWSEWVESFYEEIESLITCRQVLHFAQSKIPFDHRNNLAGHKSEYTIFEKMVMEEFPYKNQFYVRQNLGDNPNSIPETLYLFNGRLVSNIFFWHLRVMMMCQRYISRVERIFEIGGGYGSLARLWLLNESVKIKRYVIVDLPESLFFSEVCLKSEFGDQVGYWEGSDPGTKIVLVPIGRINEYKARSDLVINVGSLQEMSDSWVDFYMGWLDRYEPDFFYSLNYMGSPIVTLFESRNFWAPRPSPKWATRVLTADVPLVKMMCSGRDFAEVLYERHKPTQKFEDWSVLKGCYFNRATYLEGLELLRQEFTMDNARLFLSIVTKNHDISRLPVPKETLSIASFVLAHSNDPKIQALVDILNNVKKIGTR